MARLHPATLLRRFRGRRIGVVGDFMLDRFIRGSVARISPEAPVPLVRVAPDGEDARLGGAGNVVANLAALGARPLALGVVGADASGRLLRRKLHQVAGAKDALVVVRKRVTTVKTRIIVLHQHVVRVDWEDTEPLPEREQARLASRVRRALSGLDALVLSDYDKGVLTDTLLEEIIGSAQRAGVPVFVDLKVDRRLEPGVRLVQVSKQRAEEMAGIRIRSAKTLELVGRHLLARYPCEALVLTLGSEGMRVFERASRASPAQGRASGGASLVADRTKPWEVFDVTGAGDTVMATLTLAVVASARVLEAARLANAAAGVVVGKLGTAVCTAEELRAALGNRGGKA
ncbi:MAG: bifunctional heptose 7-phosphate kinase/heptose 1-phosphate adenyltransferase [Candidatus Acidiferrales bacterium]